MTAKPHRRARPPQQQRRVPIVLRGSTAIGTHLGMTPATIDHLHRAGLIPTFRAGGTPYATIGALDDWQALRAANALPDQ